MKPAYFPRILYNHHSVVTKSMDSGDTLPRFKFQVCHLLAVEWWKSYLTSWQLSFLIYKIIIYLCLKL